MAESIVSDFLSLDNEGMREILTERNSDFGKLSSQDQDTVISDLRSGSSDVSHAFELGEIAEDDSDFPTARQVFDFTRATGEGLAVIGGGFLGGVTGGPIGGLAGAGLAGGLAKQFFRGVEDMLGVAGAEGFEPKTIDLSMPTAEQLAGKFGEVASDIGISSTEEAGGRILAVPGVLRTTIGAGVGALADRENPVRGAAAGATVTAVGGKLVKGSGLTDKGGKAIALSRFAKESKSGIKETEEQIRKNVLDANNLIDKIPGLKFAQGDLTGDASALALQKEMSSGVLGKNLEQSEKALANRVIDVFFKRKAVSQGRPGAFIEEVEQVSGQMVAATKAATDSIELEVRRLSQNIDPELIGKALRAKLKVPLNELKKTQNALFESVPKLRVKTQPLADAIDAVKEEFVKNEPKGFRPNASIKQIENEIFKTVEEKSFDPLSGVLIGTKTKRVLRDVELQKIRGINQTLNELIRKASKGAEPNRVLARRLKILKSGIDGKFAEGDLVKEGAFQLTERTGDSTSRAINTLRQANAARRSQAIRFEQGSVADVLQTGRRGEESRIAIANIASEFNSLQGIDDLAKALGSKDAAKEAMTDFYRMDLLNARNVIDASTGELKKKAVDSWLKANAGKLKKLGIRSEFDDLKKLQEISDDAMNRLDVFNKSVAGRVLDSDADTFISKAFTGKKPFARTASELMALAGKNPEAKKGLKRAIMLHIRSISDGNTKSFFQRNPDVSFDVSSREFTKNIKKFQPALDVIYRDEPTKIKALKTARDAFNVLSRSIGASRASKEGTGGAIDALSGGGIAILGGTSPRSGFALKNINNMVRSWGQVNTNKYLRRMVFDPDYALALMSEKEMTPFVMERLMVGLIHESGIIEKSIVSSLANPIPQTFNPEATISQGR